MSYWDTSCLLKLYVLEADSAVFESCLLRGATRVTSELTRLELHTAVIRKETAGDLRPGWARRTLAAYDADVAAGLISVRPIGASATGHFDSAVERCYRRVPPIYLRTLDAIHMATALASGESELVVADKRLRDPAISFCLAVFPPP